MFINECKSCEIGNQMFFNVMFLFLKIKVELVVTYWKIKLLSGATLHGVLNGEESYLEPNETSMREHFCENI